MLGWSSDQETYLFLCFISVKCLNYWIKNATILRYETKTVISNDGIFVSPIWTTNISLQQSVFCSAKHYIYVITFAPIGA